MSIIEVMIAIFIFTMWIASVFMIITSAWNINNYNKDFIIASNLAREQVELIRNIRDTNYKKFQRWNISQPKDWTGTDYDKVFLTGNFYKIENDFSASASFHIKSSTWAYISDFKLALKDITNTDKENYRLCLNSDNKYIYCEWTTGLKQTQFYKYIEIQQLKDWAWTFIENSFKINSKVYWNKKGIHKVEIPTILANYKRL
jgi:hypothetical protein